MNPSHVRRSPLTSLWPTVVWITCKAFFFAPREPLISRAGWYIWMRRLHTALYPSLNRLMVGNSIPQTMSSCIGTDRYGLQIQSMDLSRAFGRHHSYLTKYTGTTQQPKAFEPWQMGLAGLMAYRFHQIKPSSTSQTQTAFMEMAPEIIPGLHRCKLEAEAQLSFIHWQWSPSYAFDIMNSHGQPFLVNRRLFALADGLIPDGIKCDSLGNVYSGCADGIAIWSPGGVLLGKILLPGGVSNFCFCREGELIALNETRLWQVRLHPRCTGALLMLWMIERRNISLLRGVYYKNNRLEAAFTVNGQKLEP